MKSNKYNICIIGLGYVGLPLAIEFGKKFLTIGYDINIKRIDDLNNFKDSNNEIATYDFKKSKKLIFSNNETDITNSNVYILTLPTPINKKNKPELTNIKETLRKISSFLKKNDIIIFESTFYPGLTDEICIPLIEKISKLKVNKDFGVGYSPERINPSDNKRKLKNDLFSFGNLYENYGNWKAVLRKPKCGSTDSWSSGGVDPIPCSFDVREGMDQQCHG